MKVLLDECIPRKLKGAFVEDDDTRAPEAGLGVREWRPSFLSPKAPVLMSFLIVRAKSGRIQDLLAHVGAGRGIIRSIQWVAKSSELAHRGRRLFLPGSILRPGLFVIYRVDLVRGALFALPAGRGSVFFSLFPTCFSRMGCGR
jgi:hypothetical protein